MFLLIFTGVYTCVLQRLHSGIENGSGTNNFIVSNQQKNESYKIYTVFEIVAFFPIMQMIISAFIV